MPKRASKKDFARVRAVIQRETAAGKSFEEAGAIAAREEPEAFRRIMENKDDDLDQFD
jgi:hypothetical protein